MRMYQETGAEASAAIMSGRLPTNPEMLEFTNVSFHHIPNAIAPSVLALNLTFSFCAGIVFLELANNVHYDFLLIKRSTWREPVKLFNRLAYIFARYGALVFLVCTVYFGNMPGVNCTVFARFLNISWLLPLIFVDVIFLQRTLVLYAWSPKLTGILTSMYVVYVGLCAYSIAQFGFGYRIALSDFCGYQVDMMSEPHFTIFIAFYSLLMVFDTTLLLLTMHRLIDGGLAALPDLIFKRHNDGLTDSQLLGKSTLSNLLLRQGVVYYVGVGLSRIAFLIVYYCTSDVTSYQILIASLLVTMGPVMAGMLFRQTTSAVRRTAYGRHEESPHEFTSSVQHTSHLSTKAIGTTSASTAPWAGASSPPDMAEESGHAFTLNATPSAARRRTSLSLEAGNVLTRSDDDDEEFYGPGGFFNRIRRPLRERPQTGDSRLSTKSDGLATPKDAVSLVSTMLETKGGEMEVANVPHLYNTEAASPSSAAATPDSTPESVISVLPPSEFSRRPHSRPRRVPHIAPLPASQHLPALPQPSAEPMASVPDVPVNCADDSDVESHTGRA